MSSQRFRRLAPAAALAAALALATPVHAAAPSPWLDPARLAQRTLQWLTTLWATGPRTPAVLEKAGAGVDPNGSPAPTGTSTCTGDCERGHGIDPNG